LPRGADAIPPLLLEPQPHVNAPVDPSRAHDAPRTGALRISGSRLAIVGNAPGIEAAAAIDAAPSVVRFNNAAGFRGRTGSRVTHLALVNRGGQMREWLADPGFLDRPVVRAAEAFILPFPMLPAEHNRPEQVCWTREALALLAPLGKPVHVLPEDLHREGGLRLGAGTMGRPNPALVVRAGRRLRLRLRRLARSSLGGRACLVRRSRGVRPAPPSPFEMTGPTGSVPAT
jgi:hypothetical protein